MSAFITALFREQAKLCDRLGSPFMAELMARCADDIEAGGPTAAFIEGHADRPAEDVLTLRVAGALHAAALSRRDEALASAYASIADGLNMDVVWRAVREYLAKIEPWARAFLDIPPQTNEVARAAALLPGFMAAAEGGGGKLRLMELGASAGLLLCWDGFRYAGQDWRWGEGEGPELAPDWRGAPALYGGDARALEITARRGCDLNPLDASDPEHALRLRAFLWADQLERRKRLDAALGVARRLRPQVERAGAADWLTRELAGPLPEGASVVYHSVAWMYFPKEEQDRARDAILSAGARASADHKLYWLQFESAHLLGEEGEDMVTVLSEWPGGERRVLARADAHGRCVELQD